MAITLPNPGTAFAVVSHAATSTSTTVPSGAAAGDLLIINATCERSEIPTITIGGSTSGLNQIRAESQTNLATRKVWKRLTTADLGQTIAMTNTAVRGQSLAVIAMRGAADPLIGNQAFSICYNGVYSKQGSTPTPSADYSYAVGLLSAVPINATGPSFSFTSTWTEQVDADGADPASITNPIAYITTQSYGAGTSGVAQTPETFTISPSNKFDSIYDLLRVAPAANQPPVVSAGVDQTVPVGTSLTLNGTATDPDGTVASRQWTCVSTPAGVTAPTFSAGSAATYTYAAAGSYTLQFTAVDNAGASSTDTVIVTVVASTPPVAAVNQNAGPGLIDARSSTASAGGTLSYSIAPSGPTLVTPGVWFAAPTSSPQTFTVTVAESSTGSSATATTTVPAATTRAAYTGSPVSLNLPTPGDPGTFGAWGGELDTALTDLATAANALRDYLTS